jgi:hypothetical protein
MIRPILCNFVRYASSTAQIPSVPKSTTYGEKERTKNILSTSYPVAPQEERQFLAHKGGDCSVPDTSFPDVDGCANSGQAS